MKNLRTAIVTVAFDTMNEAEHFYHNLIWDNEKYSAFIANLFPHIKGGEFHIQKQHGDGSTIKFEVLIEAPTQPKVFEITDYAGGSGNTSSLDDLPF